MHKVLCYKCLIWSRGLEVNPETWWFDSQTYGDLNLTKPKGFGGHTVLNCDHTLTLLVMSWIRPFSRTLIHSLLTTSLPLSLPSSSLTLSFSPSLVHYRPPSLLSSPLTPSLPSSLPTLSPYSLSLILPLPSLSPFLPTSSSHSLPSLTPTMALTDALNNNSNVFLETKDHGSRTYRGVGDGDL